MQRADAKGLGGYEQVYEAGCRHLAEGNSREAIRLFDEALKLRLRADSTTATTDVKPSTDAELDALMKASPKAGRKVLGLLGGVALLLVLVAGGLHFYAGAESVPGKKGTVTEAQTAPTVLFQERLEAALPHVRPMEHLATLLTARLSALPESKGGAPLPLSPELLTLLYRVGFSLNGVVADGGGLEERRLVDLARLLVQAQLDVPQPERRLTVAEAKELTALAAHLSPKTGHLACRARMALDSKSNATRDFLLRMRVLVQYGSLALQAEKSLEKAGTKADAARAMYQRAFRAQPVAALLSYMNVYDLPMGCAIFAIEGDNLQRLPQVLEDRCRDYVSTEKLLPLPPTLMADPKDQLPSALDTGLSALADLTEHQVDPTLGALVRALQSANSMSGYEAVFGRAPFQDASAKARFTQLLQSMGPKTEVRLTLAAFLTDQERAELFADFLTALVLHHERFARESELAADRVSVVVALQRLKTDLKDPQAAEELKRDVLEKLEKVTGAGIAGSVAKIVDARGQVFLERQGQKLPGTLGRLLYPDDRVMTGAEAACQVDFVGWTSVSLVADSALDLRTKSKSSTQLYLSKGQGRFRIRERLDPADRFVVASPATVTSVRGTDFTLNANGEVQVLHGRVDIADDGPGEPAKGTE